MAVTEDLLGSSASDGPDGREITRIFHVDGLLGSREGFFSRAFDRIGIALGTPHPTEAFLVATTVNVRPVDSDQANVSIGYRIPRVERGETPPSGIEGGADAGTIRVGASQTSVQKTTDIKGNTMIVTHLTTVEKTDDLGLTVEAKEDVDITVEAEVPVPNPVLQIERLERGEPGPKARRFVGRVNADRIGSDPPRTWLCTRIDGVSTDGGFQYVVTYEFQHDPQTWDFEAVWRDPDTGEIPTDLVDGKGRKRFRVIPEANFSELRLGFFGARV